MKKAFIVMGVGLAAAVLLVVAGGVASGWWSEEPLPLEGAPALAAPAEERLAAEEGPLAEPRGASDRSGAAALQDLERQKEALSALERAYPFHPPEGQVLKLEEERLQQYLAIREPAVALFHEAEVRGRELAEERGVPSAGPESLAGLTGEARALLIENLQALHMSPGEFHTLTGALQVVRSGLALLQGDESGKLRGGERARLEKKLEDNVLSAEERYALELRVEELKHADVQDAARAGVGVVRDPEADAEVALLRRAASLNGALYARYRERIEKAEDNVFDQLVAGADLLEAAERALGKPARKRLAQP